jgi:hypothetical protein
MGRNSILLRRRNIQLKQNNMAKASDLPMELYLHILSFLPPHHAELVSSIRWAAAVREQRSELWHLKDYQCRDCGKVTLELDDGEDMFLLRRWDVGEWGFFPIMLRRQWEYAGYYVICPCGKILHNRGVEALESS